MYNITLHWTALLRHSTVFVVFIIYTQFAAFMLPNKCPFNSCTGNNLSFGVAASDNCVGEIVIICDDLKRRVPLFYCFTVLLIPPLFQSSALFRNCQKITTYFTSDKNLLNLFSFLKIYRPPTVEARLPNLELFGNTESHLRSLLPMHFIGYHGINHIPQFSV